MTVCTGNTLAESDFDYAAGFISPDIPNASTVLTGT